MAQDQIRQMVNFILQEAHEKANEIRVKTEHDFNLEKQTLVHEAKLNIQDEFAKKEKDREIQERIARSAEIQECRVKKMTTRDELLKDLVKEAGLKCSHLEKSKTYPTMLQKLIVQGLVKIDETDITLYCRTKDTDTVKKVLADATKEYVTIMQKTSGVTLKPVLKMNTDKARDLPETSYGGVKLTALNGRIVCDNTMSARLELVYEELLPSIRAILFPEQ